MPDDKPEPDGIVAHVVITDEKALWKFHDLCAEWSSRKPGSMYVDYEQSLYAYRIEKGIEPHAKP